MTIRCSSEFIAAWAAKLKEAADSHPAVPFDGREALPAWLSDSARDQAERVFLVLDSTPAEARVMELAHGLFKVAGVAFLEAWAWTMTSFGSDGEPWAKDAADAAAEAYKARFKELAPTLHTRGTA